MNNVHSMGQGNSVQYIEVKVSDYYNRPELYRFMPRSIFDELEKAFREGSEFANVPEPEFLKMITVIELSNGIQSN